MTGFIRAAAWALALLAAIPSVAAAQASIAGVVTDESGGVLPGVTVEASSPVLIEKVRSVVTDSTGRYRIVDLRPGDYAVTFTLPGFNVIRREGITLQGTFTATVDAKLGVGGLQETLTVTGESPIVDVQSTAAQRSIDKAGDRLDSRRPQPHPVPACSSPASPAELVTWAARAPWR